MARRWLPGTVWNDGAKARVMIADAPLHWMPAPGFRWSGMGIAWMEEAVGELIVKLCVLPGCGQERSNLVCSVQGEGHLHPT